MTTEVYNTLLGLQFTEISGAEHGSDSIRFLLSDGRELHMSHDQDCCESAYLDVIDGDVVDLLDSPIRMAECVSEEMTQDNCGEDRYSESGTWTFYKFATEKGYVTLKWRGTSNGYYSESVEFYDINKSRYGASL